jgi:hypothetical protein
MLRYNWVLRTYFVVVAGISGLCLLQAAEEQKTYPTCEPQVVCTGVDGTAVCPHHEVSGTPGYRCDDVGNNQPRPCVMSCTATGYAGACTGLPSSAPCPPDPAPTGPNCGKHQKGYCAPNDAYPAESERCKCHPNPTLFDCPRVGGGNC